MFSAAAMAPEHDVARGPSEIEAKLQTLSPDEMTPREALQALYDLKALQKV